MSDNTYFNSDLFFISRVMTKDKEWCILMAKPVSQIIMTDLTD